MEFKTKLDKDRSYIKVYPEIGKYRQKVTDRDIINDLSELQSSIKRHVDDISCIDEERINIYITDSGQEYESLFDALIGEISVDLYGYYRFEYINSDGKKSSSYADDFKELCCNAYYHPNGFKLCDSGSDKLTDDQLNFIEKIIQYRLK